MCQRCVTLISTIWKVVYQNATKGVQHGFFFFSQNNECKKSMHLKYTTENQSKNLGPLNSKLGGTLQKWPSNSAVDPCTEDQSVAVRSVWRVSVLGYTSFPDQKPSSFLWPAIDKGECHFLSLLWDTQAYFECYCENTTVPSSCRIPWSNNKKHRQRLRTLPNFSVAVAHAWKCA